MQTKHRIDRDTRTLLTKYCRKYDEYVAWYVAERNAIICPASRSVSTDAFCGAVVSNPTLAAAVRLERLETSHRVHVIRAIDEARMMIGNDLQLCEREELALKRAIWLSCQDGRAYSFEIFAGMVAVERTRFYYEKNVFLNRLKDLLQL